MKYIFNFFYYQESFELFIHMHFYIKILNHEIYILLHLYTNFDFVLHLYY